MTTLDHAGASAAGGHHEGGHAHPPHLAHHFDTPEQQFDSGKLGMWLFLATEILLFGGLFCAYAVYRSTHPEIFEFGHQFLDKKMGGINTIVLICSSFTMAWAVRCAQLGKRTGLLINLVLTLLCAFGFMGIKYVEYTHKIHSGLLWGTNYNPHLEHGEHGSGDAHSSAPADAPAADALAVSHEPAAAPHTTVATPAADPTTPASASAPAGDHVTPGAAAPSAVVATVDRTVMADAAPAPAGLAPPAAEGAHGAMPSPKNVQIFFGIYFAMTGLHGFHVLAGMICITWLIFGAAKGKFSPEYFTPVDLVGLYWHIVDLIWIFLFPLLYLIH